jgi:predicted amidohydrolase YtcJ
MKNQAVCVALLLLVTAGCRKQEPADLVLLNGKVATVDEAFSIREAVAVKQDAIVFVGSSADARAYCGDGTRVIDGSGLLVLPGLIDAHAHLHDLGDELSYLNITGTGSYAEILEKVAEKIKAVKPGEWILGGRWDQNDWEDTRFPEHDKLSALSPENPIYLTRVDGNAAFVNHKALEVAGITKDTPEPKGGVIHRKPNGEPTGVLINRAMNLVKPHIPPATETQKRGKFMQAVDRCLALGLTGVHEAGVGPDEIALYKKLIDEGKLALRIYAMLGEQEVPTLEGELLPYFQKHRIEQYGGQMLSVRSIKLYFDGALGSRGAAFFDPYADDPGNIGLLRITPDYITQVARAALQAGMGVNTHCIGIRGNRLCLEAYADALAGHPAEDHRFRIEHAQIVRPEDVRRFVELGIIPAMQPTHCTSDMDFVEERIGGERAAGAYAWRWFLDAGLIIPCGSDFPVESPDPKLGLYAAVTRQRPDGQPPGGWNPEHCMSIEEAVRGFTIWAAHAAFQEDILGSIEPGKLADFTILDRDFLSGDAEDILQSRVVYTVVGGKIRYQNDSVLNKPN